MKSIKIHVLICYINPIISIFKKQKHCRNYLPNQSKLLALVLISTILHFNNRIF